MNAPNQPNNRPPPMRSAAPAPFTMKLSRGPRFEPPRLIVHGDSGLGKSSLAADAPSPAFIDLENGTDQLDVARNEDPITSWDHLMAAVRWYITEPHEFKTLVIDTVDRAESLSWEHLCAKERVDSIEKVGKGYGKGYRASSELFRVLVRELETLRKTRRMTIILLAHSRMAKEPHADEEFDRWHMNVHANVRDVLYQNFDAVFFARKEIVTRTAESGRIKGIGGKKHILETIGGPGWFAKNRYHLPEQIELTVKDPWAPLAEGFRRGASELTGSLIAEIEAAIARLSTFDATAATSAAAALASTDPDATALSALLARVNTGIARREAGDAPTA